MSLMSFLVVLNGKVTSHLTFSISSFLMFISFGGTNSVANNPVNGPFALLSKVVEVNIEVI